MLFLLGIFLGVSLVGFAQTIEEEDIEQEYPDKDEFKSKRQKLSLDEIPQAVKRGLANSQYASMQVVEANILSAEEAKKMLEGDRDIKVITEETMLYELKVEEGNHSALLYFTENGELYNVANEEGIG